MTIFNDSFFYNAMAECALNSVAAAVTSIACVRTTIASYVSVVLPISYMRSYINSLQF